MFDSWSVWAPLLLSSLWRWVRPSEDVLLFMNGATWAQLWSGVIGALLGSIAAALVASYVLRKTLAAQLEISAEALALQRRLATEASDKQAALAHKQMEEQRAGLELQLAEQRSGLEQQLFSQNRLAAEAARLQKMQAHRDAMNQQGALRQQLDEQRAEAAKVRAYAAISDLVAAADACTNDFKEGGVALRGYFQQMKSAVVRWSLDLEDGAWQDELEEWPVLIWRLASEAHIATLGSKDRPQLGVDGPADRLVEATAALSVSATMWPKVPVAGRADVVAKLRATRTEIDAASEKFRAEGFGGLVASTEE